MFRGIQPSGWSEDHIARHGVTMDEVHETIFERPYFMTAGREGSVLVYGRTQAGRYLLIVALDRDGEAFIVTARDMTETEKKTFRRKAR